MIYKYDLPVENLAITFKNAKALALAQEEAMSTPTMKLFEELECDKDTAFESFIIKHHQTFNNEVDMYGDIQEAGESQLKVSEMEGSNRGDYELNLINPNLALITIV